MIALIVHFFDICIFVHLHFARAVDEGWVSAPFSRAVTSELAASVETKEARIFKLKATTIIQEYFLSDDIGEVILSLEDLAAPDYHATFVKRLITLAMDRFASLSLPPTNF